MLLQAFSYNQDALTRLEDKLIGLSYRRISAQGAVNCPKTIPVFRYTVLWMIRLQWDGTLGSREICTPMFLMEPFQGQISGVLFWILQAYYACLPLFPVRHILLIICTHQERKMQIWNIWLHICPFQQFETHCWYFLSYWKIHHLKFNPFY